MRRTHVLSVAAAFMASFILAVTGVVLSSIYHDAVERSVDAGGRCGGSGAVLRSWEADARRAVVRTAVVGMVLADHSARRGEA